MEKTSPVLLTAIRRNPFFKDLDEPGLSVLGASAIQRSFDKGQTITHHGDAWDYIFLVQAGEVNAQKTSYEGRRLLIATFSAGDIFWGPGFFNEGALMPVSLETANGCQISLWSRESFLPILIKHPQMMWRLCQMMVLRMTRASEIIEEQAFRSNAGKLARLLLDTFRSSDGTPVARAMTLDEMAARIGTTREIVCRVLYQFSDQKLIQVTRTEFSLTDESGLRSLADS